ncbi:MAG: hypothetical protein WDL87_02750 [Candidatus Omnitrophota bacterium]|jgi:hypothetical protein
MKKIQGLFWFVVVAIFLNGCMSVRGSSRIGNARIMDAESGTLRLEKRAFFQESWRVTYKVIYGMGLIRLQEESAGRIEALIKDTDVIVQVSQVKPQRIRIEIKAGKNLQPNPELAMKIAQRIKEQW